MASCKLAQKIACTYAPISANNSQSVEAIQSPTGMKAGRTQQTVLSGNSVLHVSSVHINFYILPAQAQKR